MKLPRRSFPWSQLNAVGFDHVVSLHPASYDPAPLTTIFAEPLEDLVGGGPPANAAQERQKVGRAVRATLVALRSGHGVVVQCWGGRGRTGTVLGCVLRELGFGSDDAIAFLDSVHKQRNKPGWPESPWQGALVRRWAVEGLGQVSRREDV